MEAHNEITDDPNSGGDGAIDGYEELRRRALSGAADGWRLGLGVLQHRGVAGWLRARTATATAPARPAPTRSALPLAGDADAELVGLLASMVLGVAARE